MATPAKPAPLTDVARPAAAGAPGGPVARAVARVSRLGARPGESREAALLTGTLVLASVVISALAVVWVVTYFAYGYPLSAAIPAAYQVATVVGIVTLSRTGGFAAFRTSQLVMFLVLPALLHASLGGFVASSAMVLWACFTPLAALALLGVSRSIPWLVAFLVEVVALAALDPVLSQDPADLPPGVVITFFVLNVVGVTVSAYIMLGYFVDQREAARQDLEAERERSERLLLNVLPGPIAERLKDHDGVLAERHDEVTVLFADLVGFTAHSAHMRPEDLVALLDRIFTAFDDLAGREGVEKIKTIGDAYMLAGGLPTHREGHAASVARVAVGMRRELAAIAAETDCGWLALRIGMDTGPAVAGVIGRRKFIYDLWGDTVNTASRMESHGLPGRIQVTERVAAAVGDAFSVEPRGTVLVKGKGLMTTYLLEPAEQ